MASFERTGLTFHKWDAQWLGPGSWSLTLSGISRRGRLATREGKRKIDKKMRVLETYLMENGEIRRRDGKWKSQGRR